MKHLFLVAIFLFLGSTTLFAQHAIGHTTITFNDASRTGGFGSGGGAGRQIQSEIYYPAVTAGNNTAVVNGSFPVIVFGHGFVMSWDAYQNIWEELVPEGYILVFPRTEGGFSPVHNEFALDLALCVNKMQALNSNSSSLFFNHVSTKSALMGHSMGGGASILAAANNTTIETVIGLAPAETSPSAITAAVQVTVPALIFSGSSDGVTPPNDHHVPIYNSLSSLCKYFISITGGAHCYFANSNFNCDFGEGASSTGISITRAQQHAILFEYILPWLDYKLKNNCTSAATFTSTLNADIDITFQEDCSIPAPVISASGSSTICEGDNLQLNSVAVLNWSTGSTGTSITVNAAGTYFGTDANCQISNSINVTVNEIDSVTQVISLCNGQSYSIGTNTYTTNGNYFDVLTGSNNCDSVVNTQLTFSNATQSTDVQNTCGPITWIDGNVYSTNNNSATYTIVGGSAFGCDSVITLNLTIQSVDVSVTNNGSQLSSAASGATFQWLDCNASFSEILGETSSSYSPTANGNYALEVTQNGCTDTSSCMLVSSISIEENNFIVVNIFPNPTDDLINIEITEPNVELSIYSVLGELIYHSVNNSSGIIQIDLGSASGMYIVELNANGIRRQYKVIKK